MKQPTSTFLFRHLSVIAPNLSNVQPPHALLSQTCRLLLGITVIGCSVSAQAVVAEPSKPENSAAISVQKSTDGIVALVNDRPILKSELKAAMLGAQAQLQASGQTISPQQLKDEVLNQLILQKLQLEMIERAGIRIPPEVVDQRLLKIAQTQGLSALTQLQQIMDSRQMGSYAQLRQRIIQEESLKALTKTQLNKRVRITEQDIEAFLASPEAERLQSTEYRTIHIRVPFNDDYNRITEDQKLAAMRIADQIYQELQQTDNAEVVLQNVSMGAAEGYPLPLQGGDVGYHEASGLPVEIADQITPLAIGGVTTPQITPQGIDVVKLVDKRGNESMVIPQWHVRHILIANDGSTSESLAEQEINSLYDQLRQGADFATLASTYSDDPGSAGRGGDLDWVSEGQMVPEFEETIQRTSVGDYSAPFKSQFGWHILKVEEQRQKDVSDVVKYNMAREALYQRLAPQAQEDWLQELRANAYIRILD